MGISECAYISVSSHFHLFFCALPQDEMETSSSKNRASSYGLLPSRNFALFGGTCPSCIYSTRCFVPVADAGPDREPAGRRDFISVLTLSVIICHVSLCSVSLSRKALHYRVFHAVNKTMLSYGALTWNFGSMGIVFIS